MSDTRQRHSLLLAMTLMTGIIFAVPAGTGLAQTMKRRFPAPPPSAQDDSDQRNPPAGDPQSVRKAQLAQIEKEFREGVERLYELSGELHEEVQKTPPSRVLSVSMYKKAEEIERLAKRLKTKAKGG
jgi:hypothetical protein